MLKIKDKNSEQKLMVIRFRILLITIIALNEFIPMSYKSAIN